MTLGKLGTGWPPVHALVYTLGEPFWPWAQGVAGYYLNDIINCVTVHSDADNDSSHHNINKATRFSVTHVNLQTSTEFRNMDPAEWNSWAIWVYSLLRITSSLPANCLISSHSSDSLLALWFAVLAGIWGMCAVGTWKIISCFCK